MKIQYSRQFFQFDKKFYQGLKNLDYAIVVNHFQGEIRDWSPTEMM